MTKQQAAQGTYNSEQDYVFQRKFWNGSDMHTGIYRPKKATIAQARQNTTDKMVRLLPKIKKSSKILILGSGFGETARYLAEKYGCKVDCLNLNEDQNEYNRKEIEKIELQKKINVYAGSIESIPLERETYDIVWSQENLVYSERKPRVFRQIHRVLQSSGRFVFCGPMLSEDCPEDKREKMMSQLPIKEVISFEDYDRLGRRGFLQRIYTSEMTDHLELHYQAVLDTLEKKKDKVVALSSKKYHDKLIADAKNWIKYAEAGCLDWGILVFQKINS
jgi:sarcosine/dimethylglycine N-methyltransferase